MHTSVYIYTHAKNILKRPQSLVTEQFTGSIYFFTLCLKEDFNILQSSIGIIYTAPYQNLGFVNVEIHFCKYLGKKRLRSS